MKEGAPGLVESVVIRPYTAADIPELIEIQRECFPPPYPQEQLWTPDHLESHIRIFPEGQLCAAVGSVLAGSCTNLIVDFRYDDPDHSWAEITGDGYIRTHTPRGNSLYGVDIAVRPAFRGQGIARRLYQARFDLVRRLGLVRFLAAGRMPGYHRYAGELTPDEYAAKVVAGELADPVITPQLRAGLRPVRVIHDYIPDVESGNCALLLEWRNPDREDE